MKNWRTIIPLCLLLPGMMLPAATGAQGSVSKPGAPGNVFAIGSNGAATVTWMAPSGSDIVAYHIRAFVGSSGHLAMESAVGLGTSAVIQGLNSGSQYSFTVQALSRTGPGPQSIRTDLVNVAGPPIPPHGSAPAVPTNVDAHATNGGAIVVWQAPPSTSTVTAYQLLVSRRLLNAWVPVPLSGLTITSPLPTLADVQGLTNGVSYMVRIRALNGFGWGPLSAPTVPFTPTATTLNAPSIVSATPGNGSVALTWAAPSGYTPDHYLVCVKDSQGTMVTYVDGVMGQSTTISGLTNGATYTFEVQAVDGSRLLSQTAVTNAIPAGTVPAAPTNVSAVAGNGQATVSWTVPNNGGFPITYYHVNIWNGNALVKTITVAGTVTSTLITGLANGTAYAFSVYAENQAGTGPESQRSAEVAPTAGVTPGQPANVVAYASSGTVLVSWLAPSSGSSPITGYTINTYRWTGASWAPVTVAVTPQLSTLALVSGLVTGYTYRFSVTATNAVGSGPESAPSLSVVPTAVLGPNPTNLSAFPGNGSVFLTWSNPNAGVDHYLVRVYDQAGHSISCVDNIPVGASGSSATISGLANGTTYTFVVYAINSTRVMSLGTQVSATVGAAVPGKPTQVAAKAASGSATVTWAAPYSGGSPITGYAVRAYVGSVVFSTTQVLGPATSATVTGLTPNLAFTFTVQAQNVVGFGPESDHSGAVAPLTLPGPPLNVTGTAGVGQATVSWQPAVSTGGSPVLRYLVALSPNPGNAVATVDLTTTAGQATWNGTAYSITVSSLAAGQSYTFYVYAVAAAGVGPASAPSNVVTIPTTPGPVQNVTVKAADQSVNVSWTAPQSTGGMAITGYRITASDGVHAPIVVATAGVNVTLTGLIDGTTYTITIAAFNAVGSGPAATATAMPFNASPTLTIPGTQTVEYTGPLDLSVMATGPESSDHLILTAAGLPTGLTFTDQGNGSGKVTGQVMVPAGTYQVTFTVDDGHNNRVSQQMAIVVTPKTLNIAPLASTPRSFTIQKGKTVAKPVTLHTTITQPNNGTVGPMIFALPVTYTLSPVGPGTTLTRQASTSIDNGRINASARFRNLGTNVYRVSISVGGQYYKGSADTLFTVYNPSVRGTVSGEGNLIQQGAQAYLQFNAQAGTNNVPTGQIMYVEHHPTGDYTLQGTVAGGLIFHGRRAFIQGRGSLNGVSGYRFALAMQDFGPANGHDRVSLWLIDPHYQLVSGCSFMDIGFGSGDTHVRRT